MAKLKAELSQKDEAFREFALNGKMWNVLLKIGIPLALYQGLVMLFKFLDSLMAANIGTDAVSAVSFMHQITMMISSIGGGLAIGASMKISEAYGAGDFMLVKRRVSSVYAVCMGAGALIIAVVVPFSEGFLRLNGTPESLIAVGNAYFRVEIIATVLSFFNNIYISIERARGNTKRILYINLIVSVIKLIFTAIFVYALKGDVVMIAVATLISQFVFLLFSIVHMRGKDNAFGFSFRAVRLNKPVSGIMVIKSIPVMAEKIAFALGKLIVNAMSTRYGDTVVGALGISNNLSGLGSSVENGFQEAGAAIISQNLGAGKRTRAIDAFKRTLLLNVIIGGVFMTFTLIFLQPISAWFSSDDPAFRELIQEIYSFEAFAAVALGVNASVMALLYGFGLTKITLLLNFARVFLFRVPVLWFLQTFTNLGSRSVGMVMLISNVATGAAALLTALIVVRKIKRGEI